MGYTQSPCEHLRHTKPIYSGGNYGHYGTQKCLDCGATSDNWTPWTKPHCPFPPPKPELRYKWIYTDGKEWYYTNELRPHPQDVVLPES